jgi:hypothetical protein
MKKVHKITKKVDPFKLFHKLFNNSNHLQRMSDNNKIVIEKIKNEWFQKEKKSIKGNNTY